MQVTAHILALLCCCRAQDTGLPVLGLVLQWQSVTGVLHPQAGMRQGHKAAPGAARYQAEQSMADRTACWIARWWSTLLMRSVTTSTTEWRLEAQAACREGGSCSEAVTLWWGIPWARHRPAYTIHVSECCLQARGGVQHAEELRF